MSESFGVFIVSEGGKIQAINSFVLELINSTNQIEKKDLTGITIINRLIELAVDPDRTRSAIELGINNVADFPIINLHLGRDVQRYFQLFIFPGQSKTGYAWGGLLVDRGFEKRQYLQHIQALEGLSSEVRRTGAQLKGNLDALIENISTWPQDVVAEFLSDLGQQITTLNRHLDLMILFEESLDRFQYFPEIISVPNLIDSVLAKLSEYKDRLKWIAEAYQELPGMKIDAGLTTIAFEFLVLEMLSLIPAGQGIDITAALIDDSLAVSLVSNLPLTLPGLEEKISIVDMNNLNIRLELAQRLISQQGGELRITQQKADSIIGMKVEVNLPTAMMVDQSSLTSKKEIRAQGSQGRVLVAFSRAEFQSVLQQMLVSEGYRVDLAVDGRTALDIVQRIHPDMILVERNLPGLDGLLLTQGIRRWSSIPIIMVSSREDPDDLLHAFQAGVDDYIRVPFRSDEMLVRIQAAIRRGKETLDTFTPEIFSSKQVRINYSNRQVWIRADPVTLTPIEYNLLAYMSRHKKQVLTYEQLIERAWTGPEKGTRQGLFVHIRRLRKKVERDPKNPQIIQNKWGVGYIFLP